LPSVRSHPQCFIAASFTLALHHGRSQASIAGSKSFNGEHPAATLGSAVGGDVQTSEVSQNAHTQLEHKLIGYSAISSSADCQQGPEQNSPGGEYGTSEAESSTKGTLFACYQIFKGCKGLITGTHGNGGTDSR